MKRVSSVNKNKIIFTVLLLTTTVLSGCSSSAKTPEAASPEEEHEKLVADMMADVETYKSKDGWSVKYHKNSFDIEEGEGFVRFTYKEGTPGANVEEIRYITGKQPEEALTELTDTWSVNPEEIDRSESFFPGTDDKWGFWRTYTDGNSYKTAIAGEYNDGVLIFYSTEEKTEENVTTISDSMSEIVDSIQYDNFEPQKEYDYVPGTYVMTSTEEIEGEEISAEYKVTLNTDHTGTISMQDDVDVMWGSIELMKLSPDFEKYEYTIEGDNLMLNYDGQWMEFTRK